MIVLHFYLPVWQVLADYVGITFIITGIGTIAYSANTFKKADTPLIPFHESTALVVSGLYRYTRNPMYLGMLIILTGIGIFLGSLSPFIIVIIFFFIIQEGFIKHEEPFLENIFGEEYREYKTKVRRWI